MKKLISVLLALLMLTSVATGVLAAKSAEFTDVPQDHWAKEQISYFAEQGIINGYEDGTFKPSAGVTREEFCKILVSTFEAELKTPASPTFSDVPTDRWSFAYVERCKDFLTAYGNPFGGLPAFHPAEYATREDIAVALVKMMGYTAEDMDNPNYAKSKFSDGGEISPNLLSYVSLACEKKLISGYPDGTFGPAKGVTRAETVVLLNRATKQAYADVTETAAPVLTITNCPETTRQAAATVSGTVTDAQTVTVNGKAAAVNANGNWSATVSLVEGSNTITVVATNSQGKSVTETRMVLLLKPESEEKPNPEENPVPEEKPNPEENPTPEEKPAVTTAAVNAIRVTGNERTLAVLNAQENVVTFMEYTAITDGAVKTIKVLQSYAAENLKEGWILFDGGTVADGIYTDLQLFTDTSRVKPISAWQKYENGTVGVDGGTPLTVDQNTPAYIYSLKTERLKASTVDKIGSSLSSKDTSFYLVDAANAVLAFYVVVPS